MEGDGWTPVVLDSGMGRDAVEVDGERQHGPIMQYLGLADHHDNVKQVSALHDSFASARDAYADRDKRFIHEEIDGLLVAAGGEYVGKFINMAKDAGIPFVAPPVESNDDSPDGVDIEDV